MTINEKSPAGATDTNEAIEQSAKGSKSKAYLLRKVNHTSGDYETWSGEHIPPGDYLTALLHRDVVADMWHHGAQLVTVNAGCAEAMSAEARRIKAEKEEQRRRDEERSAQFDEELSLIKSITGMDLSREDLPLKMLEYRRAGKNIQHFLDALESIDDLDLQRVGLTAWEWDNDEG
ncbi:hypothetical protein [Corynebacterium casei]|uniref:hypothetical protein n=1 Tax=Corynebacterium casei TaxID=160386 RepID=UPI003F908107